VQDIQFMQGLQTFSDLKRYQQRELVADFRSCWLDKITEISFRHVFHDNVEAVLTEKLDDIVDLDNAFDLFVMIAEILRNFQLSIVI